LYLVSAALPGLPIVTKSIENAFPPEPKVCVVVCPWSDVTPPTASIPTTNNPFAPLAIANAPTGAKA
jgi:hypothetical protein